MIIRARKALVIVGLLSFFLTSCGLTPVLEKQEPRSEWATKWLTNPTCQPPCWENIIPGQTPIDDVAAILATTQGIHILTNPQTGPLSEIRQMDWGFDQSIDSGGAQSDETGNLVSEIYLNTYQPITTEEVINKFGSPTNVLLYYCSSEFWRKSCVVHLVYTDKGMALDLFLNDTGKNGYQVKIEPTSKLTAIYFFTDIEGAYEMNFGKNSPNYPKYYYSWEGYSNYPEK